MRRDPIAIRSARRPAIHDHRPSIRTEVRAERHINVNGAMRRGTVMRVGQRRDRIASVVAASLVVLLSAGCGVDDEPQGPGTPSVGTAAPRASGSSPSVPASADLLAEALLTQADLGEGYARLEDLSALSSSFGGLAGEDTVEPAGCGAIHDGTDVTDHPDEAHVVFAPPGAPSDLLTQVLAPAGATDAAGAIYALLDSCPRITFVTAEGTGSIESAAFSVPPIGTTAVGYTEIINLSLPSLGAPIMGQAVILVADGDYVLSLRRMTYLSSPDIPMDQAMIDELITVAQKAQQRAADVLD